MSGSKEDMAMRDLPINGEDFREQGYTTMISGFLSFYIVIPLHCLYVFTKADWPAQHSINLELMVILGG